MLCYPYGAAGENLLPYEGENDRDIITLKDTKRLKIGEPFGYDTYFLLASDQMIPDAQNIFSSEGVLTATKGADFDPLAKLLSQVGSAKVSTRGYMGPCNWSLDRSR